MDRSLIVSAWEWEQGVTARVISRIPENRQDWKPDEGSMSAGRLAWHIIAAENMFIQAVLAGRFGERKGKLERPSTVREMAELYCANHRTLAERVEGLSDEALKKPVSFHNRWLWPALQFVSFAARHAVHHRGQRSVYLCLMSEPVPSIYGPSRDEPAWG